MTKKIYKTQTSNSNSPVHKIKVLLCGGYQAPEGNWRTFNIQAPNLDQAIEFAESWNGGSSSYAVLGTAMEVN
jgi:hypothetical protein